MSVFVFDIYLFLIQGILDGEEDFPGQQVILSTGSHDSSLSHEDQKQNLLDALTRLAAAVNNFLTMYSKAFRVDFNVHDTVDATMGKIFKIFLILLRNRKFLCSM